MQRLGRLSGLGLLFLFGCGGAKPAPPPPASPASSAIAKEPAEKADLSPVAAPQDLVVVGRLKRPGPIVDTLGKWAGLPMNFRTLLGRELSGLDAVIAWDAPVEIAVALPAEGRRHGVRTVVSVGLNSLAGMLNAVRERGISPERILPEVFGFSGPSGIDCAVGPSIGNASARLVCGQRAADVEELFAYATRGLPNENLGNRDLELELRVEPLRRRYSSEIAGARLLAGFLLRQAELDNPRFDRALADATYAVADELVLWVEDTDSLELGGNLDDANKTLALELSWKFRSTRSLFASLTEELSRRPAVAPPAFGRLPGDATGAGYAVDARSEKTAALRNALVDLTDAYLEVEHAGKGTRTRARRFLTGFLKQIGAPYVQAKGSLGAAATSDAGAMLGWRLSRAELRAAEFEPLLVDFDGLLRDREVWKILAKHFELDPKALPKSRIVPLTGKGVPAGTRALVVTIPPGVTEKIRKTTGSRMKVDTKKPIQFVLAVCPDGADASVILATTDQKDAAERLRAFFAERGKRLSDRTELATMKSQRALYAEFFTLVGLFDSLSASNANPALLPSRGETPIFWNYTATPGPPLVLSAAISIPSEAFADVPGVVTNLGGSF
jgi:hypothetical protein